MADLKNVALTDEAYQAANDLKRWLSIGELGDVVRLGFAYAVSRALTFEGMALGPRRLGNYDTGGLDPEGLMAEVVRIYYPESDQGEPYRAVEHLMNLGVCRLHEDWKGGVVGSLSDLVESAHPEL